jgi:allantoinase
MTTFLVRSERVALPEGLRPATVHVKDGRIAAIGAYGDRPAGVREFEAGELVVLPGLVDTHVHINDPGRADWEGFEHATRAAAAGGVTTLVDMPLNSIPATTSVEGLAAKRRAAEGRCYVDVGFWGGVVPGNASQLAPLAAAGALGFKCFLCPSGVEEFSHVTERDLREALPIVASVGLPLLAHAELPEFLEDATADEDGHPRDTRRYTTWLDSRPPASERAAVEMLTRLAREFAARIHVVHIASADALDALIQARHDGAAMSGETCPHYLSFAAANIADGATAFKCAPPIRSSDHRERLWQALATGEIDLVATDHSPSPPALKHLEDGDFIKAWGGIASLQLGLAAVWTGTAERGMPIERLPRWLASGPATLAGLAHAKGAIAAGRDADFVLWDPDAYSIVDPHALYHRHSVTPYAGARLRSRVHATMLRGELVFEDGKDFGTARGRLL